ncbi:hypothetical protein ACIQYL_25545 [Lysinibacillus xylanilyticus]
MVSPLNPTSNQFYLGIITFGFGFALGPADVFCAKAHDAGQLAVIAWMR